MKQLSLFDPDVKMETLLVAESPLEAFYRLRLEILAGDVYLVKESGAGKRTLDKRTWSFLNLEQAEKRFAQIVRAKTNPQRKSKRRYKVVL